jgi:NAD(P)-dependent dehydrogenase (short-subunit alcohol dehydrogenase family)
MRFANQVVIVTGAGYGIGRGIAEAFAREGAHVVLAGRSSDKLGQVAAALSSGPAKPLVVPTDVRLEAEVDRLVSTAHQKLGRLDVLVNNAGIAGPTALARDVSLSDWDETLRVNLTGAFLCARRAAAIMIEARRGAIVNISSVAGRMGYPMRAPYAASKWGMIGLSHSLAAELGPFGVRVNAVLPGSTEGERIERVIAARSAAEGSTKDEVRRWFTKDTPLQRMVTAEEVARAVLFLASDEASGITGQAFSVCGGFQMR